MTEWVREKEWENKRMSMRNRIQERERLREKEWGNEWKWKKQNVLDRVGCVQPKEVGESLHRPYLKKKDVNKLPVYF